MNESLPPLEVTCPDCPTPGVGCDKCGQTGTRPTDAGRQVLALVRRHGGAR